MPVAAAHLPVLSVVISCSPKGPIAMLSFLCCVHVLDACDVGMHEGVGMWLEHVWGVSVGPNESDACVTDSTIVSSQGYFLVMQASAPALPAASPDAVQQLVAMGFDPTRAAAALQQSHNDVQTALTYLL